MQNLTAAQALDRNARDAIAAGLFKIAENLANEIVEIWKRTDDEDEAQEINGISYDLWEAIESS